MRAAKHVDLASAAQLLGVHYQTAYAWLRSGSLRARKVGKRYEIDLAELERFQRHRAAGRPPRAVQVRTWTSHVDRLHAALVSGDERAAQDVVGRLASGGIGTPELCDELLAPALRRIGDDWASTRCSIADEHRASAICERLIARLPARRTRARGTAVVTTPPGERHGLPALMAAAALRYDGWRVHHLADDLPVDELREFVRRHDPDLVVLSTTKSRGVEGTRRAVEDLAKPALVGAPGRTVGELVTAAQQI
jgi:excisionase family DNA binding protein